MAISPPLSGHAPRGATIKMSRSNNDGPGTNSNDEKVNYKGNSTLPLVRGIRGDAHEKIIAKMGQCSAEKKKPYTSQRNGQALGDLAIKT